VEAQAQMKYHHLERCFTYRMKRPMGLAESSGFAPSWFGILRRQPRLHGEQLRHCRCSSPVGTQPWFLLNQRHRFGGVGVLFRDICQMGSLAGAAYLLHDNAGVLRRAQWEQKSHVEHKRKSLLGPFYFSRCSERGLKIEKCSSPYVLSLL